MAEIIATLEKEYCPPIDSALFSAIVSDYDLSYEAALDEVRGTLEVLKQSALLEENTDFDPSGSSGALLEQEVTPENGNSEQTRSRAESGDVCSRAGETDLTSVSRSVSSLCLNGSEVDTGIGNSSTSRALQSLDPQSKISLLREMFPALSEFSISFALKKTNDNFDRAVEDLLNQVFFEEQQTNPEGPIRSKGVDGFADDDDLAFGPKTRSKKKKNKARFDNKENRRPRFSPAVSSGETSPSPHSRWEMAKTHIDFIASRVSISPKTVASIYHKNGASLQVAIIAILDSELENNPSSSSENVILESNAIELGEEFPALSPEQLLALVRITHPSTAAAHELARAATSKSTNDAGGGLKIITQYAPINLSSSGSSTPTVVPSPNVDLSTANTLATSYEVARHKAFGQASVAYRKSRSDPLMGAAAAYYSSLGRDYDTKVKRYDAAAAEALVDAQSSSTELDLHGVNVKDAIRITREKVTSWWAGLGEARIDGRSGIGRGYRIITGVGYHSEGGRGRLGPAVGRMLIREGWKVEFGEGIMVVTGVARTR
ncbi:hypothetical protein L228DRAFT_269409 [Xylona heveae TC161]|uniref:Smr domain-containing protein n=1 Tax=Xylona heveae (strain CBS 132557 / TC161) TaxID=1328760 RepID=A0A165FHV4_XYLHT|nr:hypothetical protein L228DRAFT_269409 [Xylona heveae TC161]KZF20997.1 hypothetical protein L228DRAFT_269409 [Xylona heveae TC161]